MSIGSNDSSHSAGVRETAFFHITNAFTITDITFNSVKVTIVGMPAYSNRGKQEDCSKEYMIAYVGRVCGIAQDLRKTIITPHFEKPGAYHAARADGTEKSYSNFREAFEDNEDVALGVEKNPDGSLTESSQKMLEEIELVLEGRLTALKSDEPELPVVAKDRLEQFHKDAEMAKKDHLKKMAKLEEKNEENLGQYKQLQEREKHTDEQQRANTLIEAESNIKNLEEMQKKLEN